MKSAMIMLKMFEVWTRADKTERKKSKLSKRHTKRQIDVKFSRQCRSARPCVIFYKPSKPRNGTKNRPKCLPSPPFFPNKALKPPPDTWHNLKMTVPESDQWLTRGFNAETAWREVRRRWLACGALLALFGAVLTPSQPRGGMELVA